MRISRGIIAAAAAAAGVSLTGCGDQPRANVDFHAVATHSAYSTREPIFLNSGPQTLTHEVLSGYLVDDKGRQIRGTLFHEDCASLVSSNDFSPFHPPTSCTVVVKTATNTYVARGEPQWEFRGGVHGPYYGMFGSLGPGGGIGPGSAVMWLLPDGSGTSPIHMTISFRLWGSEPIVFPVSGP